jgi:YHS domain-containing protein
MRGAPHDPRQQLLVHHPSDKGQNACPIHSSSPPADSQLLAQKIVASGTRRGYAGNGQLTVFSTVLIFDQTLLLFNLRYNRKTQCGIIGRSQNMTNISRRAILCGVFAVGALSPSVISRAADSDATRVALRGYDPVNYFTEGRPEKGSAEFSALYDNATYWFKSAENQKLFLANPDKYAPQFGGFCAIDLSRGLKTEPDPEAWTIANGKLYVFGKKRGPGVFAEDGPSILAKATENWPELRKQ